MIGNSELLQGLDNRDKGPQNEGDVHRHQQALLSTRKKIIEIQSSRCAITKQRKLLLDGSLPERDPQCVIALRCHTGMPNTALRTITHL
jgi:hypothetical protein